MSHKDDGPMKWTEVAGRINVKSRKTIAKLVKGKFLTRLAGIKHLVITRESFEAYVAGKSGANGPAV